MVAVLLPTMLIFFRVFQHNRTLRGHLSFTVWSFVQDNLLGGGTLTYEIHFCKIKTPPSFPHCHFVGVFFPSILPCFYKVEQSTAVEACSHPILTTQIFVAMSAYLEV